MAVAYEIVLDKFSGPLDLLLHLIRKNEIQIHDIPIATITSQYLSYLRTMEELSLEIASEFVVMAATLLAIKSRMLLPKPPVENEEVPEDPREELVQQLLEYERCKRGADELKHLSLRQSNLFSRESADMSEFLPSEPPKLENISLWELVDSLRQLLRRVPQRSRVAEIPNHVVSVDDVMRSLVRRLRVLGHCSFFQLLGSATTRQDLVSGFLALLELLKNGTIQCTQRLPFSDIEISFAGGDKNADANDSAD